MPFTSKHQLRYLFANNPELAKKWIAEYGKAYLKDLPEHKPKAKKKARKRKA